MKIAIAILNWNGKTLLEQFLPNVIAHSQGATVHVIDNASEDGSVEFINTHYPTVNVVQNDINEGFAKGYNDGLRTLEADIFCLLNSDVEVTPNWLKPIFEAFQTLPNASIVQPKVLDLKRREYFEYAGAAGGFIDKLGYPFCRGRIFQALEKDKGQYNDTTEVFWATGACMFIKSSVFWALEGFDEDYFAHQEEIDLCWRAKNTGYKVYYVGTSEVYHMGGSTLGNMNPKKTFLNFRNSLYSITKNLPGKRAFCIIFLRSLLDGVAAIRFVLQFKFNHCVAVLKAHMSFYLNFPKIYRKREKVNFVQKYYATTSIVWSHFVHQITRFNILIKH